MSRPPQELYPLTEPLRWDDLTPHTRALRCGGLQQAAPGAQHAPPQEPPAPPPPQTTHRGQGGAGGAAAAGGGGEGGAGGYQPIGKFQPTVLR